MNRKVHCTTGLHDRSTGHGPVGCRTEPPSCGTYHDPQATGRATELHVRDDAGVDVQELVGRVRALTAPSGPLAGRRRRRSRLSSNEAPNHYFRRRVTFLEPVSSSPVTNLKFRM
jgi:hypothetical protein